MPKDSIPSRDQKSHHLDDLLARIKSAKARSRQLDEEEKIAKAQEEKNRAEMRQQANEARKSASQSKKNAENSIKNREAAQANKEIIERGLSTQLSEAIDDKIDYLPSDDEILIRSALYKYCRQYVYTVIHLNSSKRDNFKYDFWQYATKYFGENGFWASAGSIFFNMWSFYLAKRVYCSPKLKYQVKFDDAGNPRPVSAIVKNLGKGFTKAYKGFMKEFNITLLKLPDLPPDDDTVSTTEQVTATSTQVSDGEVVDSSSEKTSATSNRAV